jgi:hypothetical protein
MLTKDVKVLILSDGEDESPTIIEVDIQEFKAKTTMY